MSHTAKVSLTVSTILAFIVVGTFLVCGTGSYGAFVHNVEDDANLLVNSLVLEENSSSGEVKPPDVKPVDVNTELSKQLLGILPILKSALAAIIQLPLLVVKAIYLAGLRDGIVYSSIFWAICCIVISYVIEKRHAR
jgi:hypothetical protein